MKLKEILSKFLKPSGEAPKLPVTERPTTPGFRLVQMHFGTMEPPEFVDHADRADDADDTFEAETVGLFHDDADDPYAVSKGVEISEPTGRKWDQLREAAKTPSLYERYEAGEDRPVGVTETQWQAVARQFNQDISRENTPDEFVPGTPAYGRAHM